VDVASELEHGGRGTRKDRKIMGMGLGERHLVGCKLDASESKGKLIYVVMV
jgi:hypothetical protein